MSMVGGQSQRPRGGRRPRGLDRKRGLLIGAQAPEDDAELMRPAVPDLAAAGFHQPAEGTRTVTRIVGTPAQGAEPHVPVELGRWIAVRKGILVIGGFVVPAVDLGDPAYETVTQGPAGVVGRFARCVPGHRPGLLRLCLRAASTMAWPSRTVTDDGFSTYTCFAGLAGMHGLNRVPVIGGGDHHRVDVPAL